MKSLSAVLCSTLLFLFTSCSGDPSSKDKEGYFVKKENDWSQMELKGRVKSFKENEEGRWSHQPYYRFNPAGYITEIGHTRRIWGNDFTNVLKETRKYNADNILIELIEYEGENYKKSLFDEKGKLLEKQHYTKGYTPGSVLQLSKTEKFTYKQTGKRAEDTYRNDIIYRSTTYDKYRNILSEITHDGTGKALGKSTYAYDYDKKGNMIRKIKYKTQIPPFEKAIQRIDDITYFEYDKQNRLIYRYSENGEGGAQGAFNVLKRNYDEKGNLINKNHAYEYDSHGNWVRYSEERYGSIKASVREYEYYND